MSHIYFVLPKLVTLVEENVVLLLLYQLICIRGGVSLFSVQVKGCIIFYGMSNLRYQLIIVSTMSTCLIRCLFHSQVFTSSSF